MNFVIDRSKWRCGGSGPHMQGTGPTELLNNDGFMCCLGHVCNQLGANGDAICMLDEPADLFVGAVGNEPALNEITRLLVDTSDSDCVSNNWLAIHAMRINDNALITDAERESKLTKLFAEHGHTLTFTGSYHEPIHSVPTCVPDCSL